MPPTSAEGGVGGYRHGRVPRAVRAEQLLDVATQLFLEHGYNGFSMGALCTAAGVSRPVAYEYFASKDAAYLACVQQVRGTYERLLAEHVAGVKGRDDLARRASDFFMSYVAQNPRSWSLIRTSTTLDGPVGDQLRAMQASNIAQISGFMQPFAPKASADEVTAAAYAVSGAGVMLAEWLLSEHSVGVQATADHFRVAILAMAGHLVDR